MSSVPYPSYQVTGVSWLSEVPSHWRVDRVKWSVGYARNGVWGEESQGDETDLPCIRVADFDRISLRVSADVPTIRSVPESDRRGRILSRNDLLLEKSGGGDKQPVGTVVLYADDRPAICSNFIARLEIASEMDAAYWCYVHAAAYSVRLTIASVKQTSGIQNLDQRAYFNELAPFPPLREQTAIAAFLDRETAKIDALIAEQERLIALLQEKRQAVISHAVTKGLDPTVPMKDSGIGWLGMVPSHWRVARFGNLVRDIKAGPFGSALTKDVYTQSGYRVYGQEQVIPGDFSIGDYYIGEEKYQELSNYAVTAGDILISCVGTFGKIAIVPSGIEPGIINPRLIRVRFQSNVMPEYAQVILKSSIAFNQMAMLSRGGTMDVINIGTLKCLVLPMPSLEEQRKICAFVSFAAERTQSLVDDASRAIALLRERRAALISAAVTGKIDVRETAGARSAEAA